MSFGFGVGDFIAVYDKLRYIYDCLHDAPGEVRELQSQFESFKQAVENLDDTIKDQEEKGLILEDKPRFIKIKKQLDKVAKDANKTMDDMKLFIEKYRGDSKWKKIKAAMNIEEIPHLKNKLILHYQAIIEFNTSLTAGNVIRMRKDVGQLTQLVSAAYSLLVAAQSTTNIPASSGDKGLVLFDKKKVEEVLVDRGFTQDFINQNKSDIGTAVAAERKKRRWPAKILVDDAHQGHVGVMFKELLKQVIDREMEEDYGAVVEKVNLCSRRESVLPDGRIAAALESQGKIAWRVDMYEDRQKVSKSDFHIVLCVNHGSQMIEKYRSSHPLRTYRLENFALSVMKQGNRWTSPVVTPNWFWSWSCFKEHNLEAEKKTYLRVYNEVHHAAHDFATGVLECTPIQTEGE